MSWGYFLKNPSELAYIIGGFPYLVPPAVSDWRNCLPQGCSPVHEQLSFCRISSLYRLHPCRRQGPIQSVRCNPKDLIRVCVAKVSFKRHCTCARSRRFAARRSCGERKEERLGRDSGTATGGERERIGESAKFHVREKSRHLLRRHRALSTSSSGERNLPEWRTRSAEWNGHGHRSESSSEKSLRMKSNRGCAGVTETDARPSAFVRGVGAETPRAGTQFEPIC